MIAREYRDDMVRLVETVLEEVGPREPCGEAEARLGETLRQRWRELGHAVQVESFHCHPSAFLGFIPITVGFYLGAAAWYWAAPGLALYPVVGLNLFFLTYSAVPGATDDVAGIAVRDGVAHVLSAPPRDERPALAHTERVRPDSLAVMLQVVLDMIEELDAGALEGPSGDRGSPGVCS